MAYDPATRSLFFGAWSAKALYRMNLGTHAVTTVTSIPTSQLGDIFCSDRSGHIYAGGEPSTTTMYQYTVATDTWTNTVTALPAGKSNNGSCTVSETGYLYVGDGSNQKLYRLALH
jgi:hypothetical protein